MPGSVTCWSCGHEFTTSIRWVGDPHKWHLYPGSCPGCHGLYFLDPRDQHGSEIRTRHEINSG